LHHAAEGGHANAIRILLEAGADPLVTNAAGRMPLHEAAFAGIAAGHREALEVLLAADEVDVNVTMREDGVVQVGARNGGRGGQGDRPLQGAGCLHIAAAFGHADLVAMLLGVDGIDANMERDGSNVTALHVRVGCGCVVGVA
jgi:ankyrin repeat protein